MPTYSTSDFKKGLKVQLDGEPYNMIEMEFMKPGKGSAVYRAKLRGLITGRVLDRTGRGLPGVRITWSGAGTPRRVLEDRRLSPPMPSVPSCWTEDDGHFHLAGVPVGVVRLWASTRGMEASFTPPVEVRTGQESYGVEIVMTELAPENMLRVVARRNLRPRAGTDPREELRRRHPHRQFHRVRADRRVLRIPDRAGRPRIPRGEPLPKP